MPRPHTQEALFSGKISRIWSKPARRRPKFCPADSGPGSPPAPVHFHFCDEHIQKNAKVGWCQHRDPPRESSPNTKSTQDQQPKHTQTITQYRTHARSNHLDFLDAGIEGGHVELVLLTAHTIPVHEYARACADVCSPASRARSCGRYPIPRHMQLACVARVKQGAESACNAVFEGRGNAHPGPCGGSASACMPRPVSADRRQEEERSPGRPRARSRASPPDGAKNPSVAGASKTAASRSSAADALKYMIASGAWKFKQCDSVAEGARGAGV